MTRSSRQRGEMICTVCKTRTSPLWRRGEKGEVLCNACGLYHKHHNKPRPISLANSSSRSIRRINHQSNENKTHGPRFQSIYPNMTTRPSYAFSTVLAPALSAPTSTSTNALSPPLPPTTHYTLQQQQQQQQQPTHYQKQQQQQHNNQNQNLQNHQNHHNPHIHNQNNNCENYGGGNINMNISPSFKMTTTPLSTPISFTMKQQQQQQQHPTNINTSNINTTNINTSPLMINSLSPPLNSSNNSSTANIKSNLVCNNRKLPMLPAPIAQKNIPQHYYSLPMVKEEKKHQHQQHSNYNNGCNNNKYTNDFNKSKVSIASIMNSTDTPISTSRNIKSENFMRNDGNNHHMTNNNNNVNNHNYLMRNDNYMYDHQDIEAAQLLISLRNCEKVY